MCLTVMDETTNGSGIAINGNGDVTYGNGGVN